MRILGLGETRLEAGSQSTRGMVEGRGTNVGNQS